jgi:hypothetical protein
MDSHQKLMPGDRPVIVVGCPRSGTTLLQVMLHAHPRIAIPPENRFLLPAYHRRRQFGDLRDPANRRALGQWLVSDRSTMFRDFGLDPDEVVEQVSAAPPTLGSVLATVFRSYAQRFGKPRWGDKRPSYISNLDIIRRLFPSAQIVHIVRDGRDCVASLTELAWMDVYRAAAMWAKSMDHARWAARRLGPESFYELRYERLVTDPVSELTALCDYLGEVYEPAMAEPAVVAKVAVPRRKKHHALTRRPVTGARIGSWADRLEPWEIGLCEAVLGSRLRRYGYEMSGAPAPPVAARLHYERVAFRQRFSIPKRIAVNAYHRLGRSAPVAALPAG